MNTTGELMYDVIVVFYRNSLRAARRGDPKAIE
jgi:hypothetical protein